MATVATAPNQFSSHSSRASPALDEPASASYSRDGSLPAAPPPPPSTAPGLKKAKAKKGANDATDAARQLQAKIAQLELDQAGKTEEDAEIGTSSPCES